MSTASPQRVAASAAHSLGEAYKVAAGLGGPAGAALREAARDSFVRGLHITLVASAVLLLVGAGIALRLPRRAADSTERRRRTGSLLRRHPAAPAAATASPPRRAPAADPGLSSPGVPAPPRGGDSCRAAPRAVPSEAQITTTASFSR